MPPVLDPIVAPQEPTPAPVRTATPGYKSIAVDSRYVPRSSLLTAIEGSPWQVQYYSQVLSDDSAVEGQNLQRHAVFQQYWLVRNLQIMVTSPLTASQDDESKSMKLTGTATFYPVVTPNVGDMFLADIGDGREGVLKITSSTRKNIFVDTCHEASFEVVDYDSSARVGDLNSKVVKTLEFVRELMLYDQNPLLGDAQAQVLRELKGWRHELLRQYFQGFLSRDYATLLVPGQSLPTYDPFLTQSVAALVSVWESPEVIKLKVLNASEDDALRSTSLWSAVMQRDERVLRHAFRRAGLVYARSFFKGPVMDGICHSGVVYVVYPKDTELSVDYNYRNPPKFTLDNNITAVPSRITDLGDLLQPMSNHPDVANTEPVLIHPVTVDDYYVLSQAFYERHESGQSQLELRVREYLQAKPLDYRSLLNLCQTCHAWGPVERYYYIPLLLILINAVVRAL